MNYLEIMNSYGLKDDSLDIDILIATKGRLVTDNFEFVLAFDKEKIEFDVAGTSHSVDITASVKLIFEAK